MSTLTSKLRGEWSVVSTLATAADSRTQAQRQGVEVWKSGPGGHALFEEYWSGNRELVGHATIWESAPGSFIVVWCDENGCGILSRPAEWRGNLFVLEDQSVQGDHPQAMRETFEFVSTTQFTQRLYAGPSFDKLTLIETITATRRK